MTFELMNKSQRSFGLPVGSLIILYCLFNPYIISVGLSHWRYLWVSTSCILFNQVDDLFDNITTVRVERKKEIFHIVPHKKNECWHNFSMCQILDRHLHPLGQVVFFQGQKCGVTLDLCEKMSHELRKKLKKYQNFQSETSLFWQFLRGFTGFFREKTWLTQEVFERKCPFVAWFYGETGSRPIARQLCSWHRKSRRHWWQWWRRH